MLRVICELDGLNFGLFHGEQQTGWLYRWRLVGDLPAAYLKWREAVASSAFVKVQSELRGGTVEVEWRDHAESDWSQAALHALVPHKLDLEITATAPFVFDAGDHSAIAPVRGHLSRYFFKVGQRVEIGPESPLRVTGYADAPVPANVLFHAGEFTSRDGILTVRNLGPSINWSVPVAGPMVLTGSPHLKKRQLFAKS